MLEVVTIKKDKWSQNRNQTYESDLFEEVCLQLQKLVRWKMKTSYFI